MDDRYRMSIDGEWVEAESGDTFGPVALIMAVSDMEEAVKLANDSPYGLVSYVYTKDVKKAFWIAEHLECGTVGINNVSGGEENGEAHGTHKDTGGP